MWVGGAAREARVVTHVCVSKCDILSMLIVACACMAQRHAGVRANVCARWWVGRYGGVACSGGWVHGRRGVHLAVAVV